MIFFLGLMMGCADECEQGSMHDSPGGLFVTEIEHGEAWGAAECAECHGFYTLHQKGCTDGVDLAAVRDQVDRDGEQSCTTCHGFNGSDG